MTPIARGLAIAAVHVALVAVVGGVLLYERNTLPSVWVLTTGVDPVLPIRGRYVSLNLVVEPRGELPKPSVESVQMEIAAATLSVEDGRLVATVLPPTEADEWFGWRGRPIQRRDTPAGPVWATVEAIAFFLPEDAPDPTRLKPGQELWAEVTVPPEGPPRPIRPILDISSTSLIKPNKCSLLRWIIWAFSYSPLGISRSRSMIWVKPRMAFRGVRNS